MGTPNLPWKRFSVTYSHGTLHAPFDKPHLVCILTSSRPACLHYWVMSSRHRACQPCFSHARDLSWYLVQTALSERGEHFVVWGNVSGPLAVAVRGFAGPLECFPEAGDAFSLFQGFYFQFQGLFTSALLLNSRRVITSLR